MGGRGWQLNEHTFLPLELGLIFFKILFLCMCESLPEYTCTTCKVVPGVTANCEAPRGCWGWPQLPKLLV